MSTSRLLIGKIRLRQCLPFVCFCGAWLLAVSAIADNPPRDDARQASLQRVTDDLRFLSSDDLRGRLPGTVEMDIAAEYLTDQLKAAGYAPPMQDGSFLQPFTVGGRVSTLVKETCVLQLTNPQGDVVTLTLDDDYKPQAATRGFETSGELVFVGYGIDAEEEHNYNDYRNIDVENKIVVFLRMEPQQNDEQSVFDGRENSRYAGIALKVATARRAGAAGVIFVNDGITAPTAEKDELAAYDQFGASVSRMPFVQVKRSVLDNVLAQSPIIRFDGSKLTSLAEIEKVIDDTLEPHSTPLAGWQARMVAEVKRDDIKAFNVIAVLEGEGPLAEETIVIGGHYDHIGMGAFGSRSGGRREIHNGADDNASGTCGVIELARRFAARETRPARRLVFICFSAEEMGLLGARHYVNEPLIPLEKTICMINFDMIGMLGDDRGLTIFSVETAEEFSPILDKANESIQLSLRRPRGGNGASDHAMFLQKDIPVMFFHTGLTPTYHTPEDDFETINIPGMMEIIDLAEKTVDGLLALPTAPKRVSASRGTTAPRVTLGTVLATEEGKGVVVEEVAADSLAAKHGILVGDVILEVAGEKINVRRDVNRQVIANAGKKVNFVIRRG
ncbi:MAG TPA: M28 family peptidase, partial [Pirellulaceae bacterium]|nr:M28 family peptidase [Pirellulaceae bacterium]